MKIKDVFKNVYVNIFTYIILVFSLLIPTILLLKSDIGIFGDFRYIAFNFKVFDVFSIICSILAMYISIIFIQHSRGENEENKVTREIFRKGFLNIFKKYLVSLSIIAFGLVFYIILFAIITRKITSLLLINTFIILFELFIYTIISEIIALNFKRKGNFIVAYILSIFILMILNSNSTIFTNLKGFFMEFGIINKLNFEIISINEIFKNLIIFISLVLIFEANILVKSNFAFFKDVLKNFKFKNIKFKELKLKDFKFNKINKKMVLNILLFLLNILIFIILVCIFIFAIMQRDSSKGFFKNAGKSKIDISFEKSYTPSKELIEYLKNTKFKEKTSIFYDKGFFGKQVDILLEKINNINENVKYESFESINNKVQELSDKNLPLDKELLAKYEMVKDLNGGIYISSKSKQLFISEASDIFGTIFEANISSAVLNGLKQINSENNAIGILRSSKLQRNLEEYKTFLSLLQATSREIVEVKNDKDLQKVSSLIMFPLSEDISNEMRNYVLDYIKKGGNILAFMNYNEKVFPNFNEILRAYGVLNQSNYSVLELNPSKNMYNSKEKSIDTKFFIPELNNSSRFFKERVNMIGLDQLYSPKYNFVFKVYDVVPIRMNNRYIFKNKLKVYDENILTTSDQGISKEKINKEAINKIIENKENIIKEKVPFAKYIVKNINNNLNSRLAIFGTDSFIVFNKEKGINPTQHPLAAWLILDILKTEQKFELSNKKTINPNMLEIKGNAKKILSFNSKIFNILYMALPNTLILIIGLIVYNRNYKKEIKEIKEI